MNIILINGKKRSGKDYFARLLKEEFRKVGTKAEILSFANPIKEIIAETFDITLDELDKLKNSEDSILVQGEVISNFRKILQKFGTEAMKSQFGENVWVDLLHKQAEKTNAQYIIVPDFRFLSEYSTNSITLKILNNDIDSSCTHISENELNNFVFDYVLDNTGYKLSEKDARKLIDSLKNSRD